MRYFLILEQPTWQHCFSGSTGVVTMLFFNWSKKKPVSYFSSKATSEAGFLFNAQRGEKPSMFLASDVIKRHFGAHTESKESSSLPVAKHFPGFVSRQMTPLISLGRQLSQNSYTEVEFLDSPTISVL